MFRSRFYSVTRVFLCTIETRSRVVTDRGSVPSVMRCSDRTEWRRDGGKWRAPRTSCRRRADRPAERSASAECVGALRVDLDWSWLWFKIVIISWTSNQRSWNRRRFQSSHSWMIYFSEPNLSRTGKTKTYKCETELDKVIAYRFYIFYDWIQFLLVITFKRRFPFWYLLTKWKTWKRNYGPGS